MNMLTVGIAVGVVSPIAIIWAIRSIKQLPGAVKDYVLAIKGLLTKRQTQVA